MAKEAVRGSGSGIFYALCKPVRVTEVRVAKERLSKLVIDVMDSCFGDSGLFRKVRHGVSHVVARDFCSLYWC